jgi:uncharacterized membrane protein
MKNLKDTLSTICAVLLVLSGVVVSLPAQGVMIPPIVSTIAIIVGALAGAVIGILTGKNPNGTTKVIDPATGQQDVDPNAEKK